MIILLAILGFLGLAAGSFLTVVISRLGKNETIVWGRSHCPKCDHTLSWFELIPIVSFIIQGGRCRSCKEPIPRIYPAVELVTGFLFVALGWGIVNGFIPRPEFLYSGGTFSIGGGWQWPLFSFAYYAFFAVLAVAISFYDLAYRLVPYILILPLVLVGLMGKIAGAVWAGNFNMLGLNIAVAAAAFLFFWLIWFLSKGRAMGRGDADAALAIAACLPPYVSILGFLFSFWIGAAVGILFIVGGRLGWKSQIPFTPFLFLGAIIALFMRGSIFQIL